jgi:hypothetical protein
MSSMSVAPVIDMIISTAQSGIEEYYGLVIERKIARVISALLHVIEA